jgi:hypothetical protein
MNPRRGVLLAAQCAALCFGHVVMAQPVQLDPFQFEAAVGRDDNLTRSNEAPSRLGDRLHTVSLSRRATVPLAHHVQGVVDGAISAEELSRFQGLDRLAASVAAQLQYRPSGAFGEPTFSLLASVQRDQYRSHQRTGTRLALGASARQSWTDRIDASVTLGWSRRDAADAVFDERSRTVRAHLDFAAGSLGTLYADAQQRRGDIATTSAGAESAYAAAARANAPDAAFGAGYQAYRFDGRTTIWTLGWNLPLDQKQALDFSWRQALSFASLPGEEIRYRSTLYSVSYLLQF